MNGWLVWDLSISRQIYNGGKDQMGKVFVFRRFLQESLIYDIPGVVPPPRMPVANEGLGWDPLLKMVHNPGGDSYWEGGQPKIYLCHFAPMLFLVEKGVGQSERMGRMWIRSVWLSYILQCRREGCEGCLLYWIWMQHFENSHSTQAYCWTLDNLYNMLDWNHQSTDCFWFWKGDACVSGICQLGFFSPRTLTETFSQLCDQTHCQKILFFWLRMTMSQIFGGEDHIFWDMPNIFVVSAVISVWQTVQFS